MARSGKSSSLDDSSDIPPTGEGHAIGMHGALAVFGNDRNLYPPRNQPAVPIWGSAVHGPNSRTTARSGVHPCLYPVVAIQGFKTRRMFPPILY